MTGDLTFYAKPDKKDTEENGFAEVGEAFFYAVPSYKKPSEVNGVCGREKEWRTGE